MAGKSTRQKEMEAAEYRLFAAIRTGDTETVRALLAADPAAVNAIAPKRPLDTQGMSPLQVAFCTGYHREIVVLLLDAGADVNYRPDRKWTDEGRPVLFDAVDAAIWNARRYAWDGTDARPLRLEWKHTEAEADAAFALLCRMLDAGADVAQTDHYGRNVLMEAVGEANRLCPVQNAETGTDYPGRPITPEMSADFRRIFKMLIAAGADRSNVSAYSHMSIREHFAMESVWRICGDLFDDVK